MSTATLVFRGVSKSFGTRRGDDLAVLDNIDLSVRRGEFVAILGPSGCGKSTILGISSGLLAWNEGAVEGPPAHEVSYVFQTARLLPWRTIRQNIEVTRAARSRLRDAPYERSVDEYLEGAGLSAYQHFYPGRISGGMQQRASIARAMATEPRMLLMDEPFSALDELTARSQRRALVETWARNELTVIMVTHNVLEAIAMATTIVVVSSRPARVLDRIEVDMPFPRVLTDPHVGVLQERVLGLLGVTGGDQLT